MSGSHSTAPNFDPTNALAYDAHGGAIPVPTASYHCLFRSCNFKSVDELALDAHMKVHFEAAGALNANVEPLVTGYEEPGLQHPTALGSVIHSTGAHLTGGKRLGLTDSSPVAYSSAAHSAGGRHPRALVTEPLVTEYEEPIHQRLIASSIVADSTAAPFTMPTFDGLFEFYNDGTFTCPVCSKGSLRWGESDFKRHLRKHLPGVRPYECPELGCSYKGELGFYRKDKLTDHLRNRHGRNIPKRQPLWYITPQTALAPSSATSAAASGQAATLNTSEG